MEINDNNGLQQLFQHNINNELKEVGFGLDGVGVVESVPQGPMHVIKQAIILYLLIIS